jgi:acetyl-CoA decarbonylase/synthase complex subunit beta
VDKGFKLRHIGEVISGYLKEDFEMIKKVEVEIIVDQEKVEEEIEKAREIYKERDSRVLSLTEEDVDEFYGCTLCQSFAPDHVCIITPERGSLCGATTWFDAKMAVKLGQKQNFVVEKGEKIGEGEYTGVNKEFERKSHGKIKHVRLHTVFGNPPTSCGCFEAIVFYIPEVDGFGIVHRDFKGKCVNGLKFSTMAGQTGGGVQTEGFLGIGISYISSKKFLISDGGLDRVVWMPKDLKARLEGIDFGKIADEDVDTIDKLQDFLREKNPMILEKMGKWNDHCN